MIFVNVAELNVSKPRTHRVVRREVEFRQRDASRAQPRLRWGRTDAAEVLYPAIDREVDQYNELGEIMQRKNLRRGALGVVLIGVGLMGGLHLAALGQQAAPAMAARTSG